MIKGIETKYVILILTVFYMVGIAGLSWDYSQSLFVVLIPFTILMSNLLLIVYHYQKTRKHLVVFSIIIITGFLIEALGVYTGHIFGIYSYSNVLGWKLFDTPLLIGFNWSMLVYMTWYIVKELKIALILKLLLASTLMVIYDIVLEPFAIFYGMWTWEGGLPPVQNYIAWFVISFIFTTIVWMSKIKLKNKIAMPLFFIQLLFFTILYFINI